MAGPTIGTIRGTIEIDYDGKGIIRAQDDVDKLNNKTRGTVQDLNGLSTGLAVFGGLIAGGFAVATASAVSFEKQMSAIEAVSGATADEMQRLSEKALQLGADTKFSASEAALAMEELVKAGLSVEEVLGGAADATVALAAAGEIDLPQAATIASNAMNQFNLTAADLVGVVDTIAGAANASAIDVTQFGFSLSQVGAVANLAGQTFADTATAIALMGNAGIVGSDAGTSLKTFLSNLVPTTDRAKAAFEELGLAVGESGNAFIDAQGNYKSLGEISGLLSEATKGLSESQKQVALETIFGSDAIRAASVLANGGAEAFNTMNDAIGKSTAAEVAATRMDNAAGSIEQLKGSVETLGIEIGSKFTPALTAVVDKLTDWVNAFGQLDDSTQNTIITIVGIVGGLALLSAGIIKVAIGISRFVEAVRILKTMAVFIKITTALTKAWAAVQWLLNAAMSANPIGLIIIAIIALIAGIVLLWKNSETFRNIVMAVWEAILVAIRAVVDFIKDTVWPIIKKVFEAIAPLAKGVFDLVVSIIKTAWSIISAIFAVMKTIFMALFEVWYTVVSTVMNAIWGVIKFVWNLIDEYVLGVLKFLFNTISKYLAFIWNVWTIVWNTVVDVAKAVWGFIVEVIANAVEFILAIVEKIKAFVDRVGNFFNQLKAAAEGGVGSLIDFVSAIPGRIMDAISGLFAMIYNAGRNIMLGLLDGLKSAWNTVKNWFTDRLGELRNLLPFSPAKEGPFSGKGWSFYSGEAIMEDLAAGINRGADVSLSTMVGALSGISATLAPGGTTPATTAPASTTNIAGAVTIGAVQVQGVWDFTDPMATRNMVGQLNDELENYKKGYQ